MSQLKPDQGRIEDICRKYGADYLGLFGSVITGNDRPDSDVDLLVRFLPDSRSSLLDMVRMEKELSREFGRKIDLVTKDFLSPYFAEEVLNQAKTLYGST